MMSSVLSIIFVIAIPVTFGFAIAYFSALNDFKKTLSDEMPDVWRAARGNARPLESWAPTAYKLLEKFKGGQIEGKPASENLKAAHRKAKFYLYAGAISFMCLLFSALFSGG
ncbi:hypothetical protein [Solilutibacter silvestris]|uniref:hypothetical protein n=1 Tax=Solilutibacter silvestris TaxID=1645665 RepID=UPI003D3481FE